MGGRWDSNPQPPGPQPGTLPLSYDHHINTLSQSIVTAKGETAKRRPELGAALHSNKHYT